MNGFDGGHSNIICPDWYKNISTFSENLYKFSDFLYKLFSDVTIFFLKKYGRFYHFCREMLNCFFMKSTWACRISLNSSGRNKNVSFMLVTYLGYLVSD